MVGFRTDPSPGYGENTINTFYSMERSEVLYDKMKLVCVLLMCTSRFTNGLFLIYHKHYSLSIIYHTLCVNLIIYIYNKR